MDKRLLLVDDDPEVLAGLSALLDASGWRVETADSGRKALQVFSAFDPDVVLLDVNLPDLSGLEVLDHLKRYSESTPVVMMSGVGTITTAVEAMRLGAETFLSKPCDGDTLDLVLEQASRMIATRRELEALKRSVPRSDGDFPGSSEPARELSALIERVADATTPILLQGESGSGKGFVARIIHRRSNRSRRPFVDLNCAGLSRDLLESELFGHERGAFTDATSTKPGLLEIAEGGTVFLDEIGEMDPSVQARLLKVLEDKRFRRVGGVRDIESNFRLIAASNRDLALEVSQGRFRQDLLYRLNVVRLWIPPLRERSEDIPLLAARFLEELSRELGRGTRTLSARAMERLVAYPWPGNVRELRNVLERAVLITPSSEIRVEDLQLDDPGAADAGARTTGEEPIVALEEAMNAYIRKAVEATGGNVRAAARKLRISPSTLYARLRR